MSRSGNIKVGVSGWQQLGHFYPPRTKQADMLRFYSERFSLVETATTFQGIPNVGRVQEWASSVPDGFTFNVLGFGGLTLYQRRPGDHGPAAGKSWEEVAVQPPPILFTEFAASIAPLRDSGRLGVVILQFPAWFEAGSAGFAYLARCREELQALPLAVEFRNGSWLRPAERLAETLDRLIDLEMALSVADFPSRAKEAPPRVAEVTVSRVAPVRLHGRSNDSWERLAAEGSHVAEYVYSEADLVEVATAVLRVGEEAEEVHVAFDVKPGASALEAAGRLLTLIEESKSEPDYSRWQGPARG